MEFFQGTVVAGLEQQRGEPLASHGLGRPGSIEEARKGRPFIGNRHAFHRECQCFEGAIETRHAAPEEVEDARVLGVAMQVELGRPVVVAGTQPCFTRADGVAGRRTGVSDGLHLLGRDEPLAMPALEVALGDALGGAQHLSHLGLTGSARTEQAQDLEGELGIVEPDLHAPFLSWRIRGRSASGGFERAAQRTGRSAARHRPPTVARAPTVAARGYRDRLERAAPRQLQRLVGRRRVVRDRWPEKARGLEPAPNSALVRHVGFTELAFEVGLLGENGQPLKHPRPNGSER